MGRKPDYFGGSTIEYAKKGKHYDCQYRCEDGDCMNKNSKNFGEMCRNIRKCSDYISKFSNDKKCKNKKKIMLTIKTILIRKIILIRVITRQIKRLRLAIQ